MLLCALCTPIMVFPPQHGFRTKHSHLTHLKLETAHKTLQWILTHKLFCKGTLLCPSKVSAVEASWSKRWPPRGFLGDRTQPVVRSNLLANSQNIAKMLSKRMRLQGSFLSHLHQWHLYLMTPNPHASCQFLWGHWGVWPVWCSALQNDFNVHCS